MTKCLSPAVFAILLPQIHHLFVHHIYFLFSVLYHNIMYHLLYPSTHVSCGGEVFSCPLSSLKWFQSCVAMKFRPVSPDVVRSQLAMFFALSGISSITLMSASHCTSPVGQTVPYFPKELCLLLFHSPCWLLWSNRPIFIGRVVPVYYTTFSHWRNRRMFSVALHIVSLVNTPHDAADEAVDKPSHRYLNPPFPEPFQLFSPFLIINHLLLLRSGEIYLSPLIPRASPPPSTPSIHFSLLPLSTPNQRCALRRAPLKFR